MRVLLAHTVHRFYGVAILFTLSTGSYFLATAITSLVVMVIIVSYSIGGPKFAKLLGKGGASDKASTKGPAYMALYMTKHIIVCCVIFIVSATVFTTIPSVPLVPNPLRPALIAFMNASVCYGVHVMLIYIMSGSRKLFAGKSTAVGSKMWAPSTVTSTSSGD